MFDFLTLPERTTKPRESGLTHVLDKGYSLEQVRQFLEVAGELRRHRQARLGHRGRHAERQGEDRALPELRHPGLLRRHLLRGLPAPEQARRVPGAGATSATWTASRSPTAPIDMDEEDKLAILRKLSKEFQVLSEVGSKDDAVVITPSKWVDTIKRELEAGAWKVITEGRESGTVGIYQPTGEVKDGLLDEIVQRVRPRAAAVRGAGQEAAGLVHQAVRRQREPRQHPAGRGHLGRDAARRRARRHAAHFH